VETFKFLGGGISIDFVLIMSAATLLHLGILWSQNKTSAPKLIPFAISILIWGAVGFAVLLPFMVFVAGFIAINTLAALSSDRLGSSEKTKKKLSRMKPAVLIMAAVLAVVEINGRGHITMTDTHLEIKMPSGSYVIARDEVVVQVKGKPNNTAHSIYKDERRVLTIGQREVYRSSAHFVRGDELGEKILKWARE
jgi:membrane protein implicated in regulation of membrane protease activity